MKYKMGEWLVLGIEVRFDERFHASYANEIEVEEDTDEICVYPKGSKVNILRSNEDGTYEVMFGIDYGILFLDKEITFSFSERVIDLWKIEMSTVVK
jgi:hypothetical protein